MMTDNEPLPKTPERETVRVQPFYLPPSLHASAECSQCRTRPQSPHTWILHIDRAQNERDEVKCQSFLACSPECRDELHAGLTVEYSMLGIRNVTTSQQAIAVSRGEEPEPDPDPNDNDNEEDNEQQDEVCEAG